MKNIIINMINTFLRNLEKLLGLCISIIFLCRIINTHATNIFLDFFVIVAVVVFLIWGIWAMFFGGREILILPPKLEKKKGLLCPRFNTYNNLYNFYSICS